MISKEISKKVLTIGCSYENPQGGIAQVIKGYSSIFEEFHFIPSTKGGSILGKLMTATTGYSRFLWNLLLKDYKIIHIHSSSYNSFRRKQHFIRLAKMFRKKVVYHVHSGKFDLFYAQNKKTVNRALRKCDVIIALSESWKQFFEKQAGCSKVVVINNIISYPIETAGSLKQNKKTCTFLLLSNLTKQKGIYDLLDVIQENKEEYKGRLRLHIGGKGETEKVLNFISTYELEDIVILEGWVSGNKKIELLQNSDVYILPSYSEGMPVSILEAMAYALPILTTPVGGIPEIVENNRNGLLVNPGNKQQIKEAIDRLISDPSLRQELGACSLQRSRSFLPMEIEKELVHLYNSLL